MNQREREQQHGIHTLCGSLCLSVYLPGNNYRINKAPNIPPHYLSSRLCQSFYLLCRSVYLCPFTFTLSLILTVMIWGMVSCVYFLSITRSSTERSYKGVISKHEKETYWNFVSPSIHCKLLYRVS